MPVKWLECSVQYSPEADKKRCYTCSVIDYSGRTITVKVGADYVYVDYMGPPGAPFICRGQLWVELHDCNGERAVIVLPVRGSHDDRSLYVHSKSIEFKPPEKPKTVCLLRRQK
jgi:hypothetical protein